MNRVAIAVAVVAGVAALAISTAMTSSHSSSLPLPHTLTAQQAAAAERVIVNGKPKAASTTSTTSTPGTSGTGLTTTTLAPLTSCTVTISNPAPPRGNTVETVTVTATNGAEVVVTAQYLRTRSSHSQVVGPSGTFQFVLPIAHAPIGVPVPVTAKASLQDVKKTCSTSFTPA